MSRRPLSLVVVAIASLVLSACSAAPTAPTATPAASSRDGGVVTPPVDTVARGGWSGSSG
jgi:uncharacterized lipoprotein YajG